MIDMKWQDRQELLHHLKEMGRASSAELESGDSFRRAFYPVAEHLRVFDPDVTLIVGYHGSGKSMLFKAVVAEQLLPAIIRWTPSSRLKLPDLIKQSQWLAGFPLGKDFPDVRTLHDFVQKHPEDGSPLEQVLADLWLAYLLRTLKDELSPELKDGLQSLLEPSSLDVDLVYEAFRQNRSDVVKCLDGLDERLKSENRWIFVNYDELDTLGSTDWEMMALLIRGLLTCWSDYTRRWRRLRAKIFLRTDLYANARVFTADFVKLATNRVELIWNDRNLYAMLVKRLTNASPELGEYCRTEEIDFKEDPDLGYVPLLPNVEAAQPLVEKVAGPFMGKTIKKGRTFTWVLDHLRDGLGQITPRTLVSLWGEAAYQELELGKAIGDRLLHPTSLRRALDKVSDNYVQVLKNREMPWLEGVEERLKDREVPLARDQWVELLAVKWSEWIESPEEKLRPPRKTAGEFLDFLLEIGVCRVRPDKRIDVPDLFLHGLSLRRRGGVGK